MLRGQQSEILVQWKATFEHKLEESSAQLSDHAEKHCKELLKNRKVISKFQEGRKKNVDLIKKEVHEYITTAKQEQESLRRDLERGNLRRDLFTPDKTAYSVRLSILSVLHSYPHFTMKGVGERNQTLLTQGGLHAYTI